MKFWNKIIQKMSSCRNDPPYAIFTRHFRTPWVIFIFHQIVIKVELLLCVEFLSMAIFSFIFDHLIEISSLSRYVCVTMKIIYLKVLYLQILYKKEMNIELHKDKDKQRLVYIKKLNISRLYFIKINYQYLYYLNFCA